MKRQVMRSAILMTVGSLVLLAGPLRADPPKLPPDVGSGRVAWFDLTASDLDRSSRFYSGLFAWEFRPVAGTDQALEIVAGGGAIGTLRVAEGAISAFNGVVYVQVDDAQASCDKAKELGGTVVAGFPFNLPDGSGAVGLVIDPAGHPMGVYSRTPLGAAGPEPARPPYSHAYYLFQVGPLADGSDRLIPMLLTSRALEHTGAGLRGVLVWTHERDSVSLLATDVPVGTQDVKAEERHVQVPGFGDEGRRRWYRYQRVGLSEARRLLAHPEGVIPVHRIGVPRETLDALLRSLPEAGE